MMLHQKIPISRRFSLIGLIQKVTEASEVDAQFVFQIKEFVKSISFFVFRFRASRLFRQVLIGFWTV